MRQAVAYARVSSKEQEKEGFSIPSQLKLLRDYVLVEGIQVVEEYVDVETAKQAGRSSFGEMMEYHISTSTWRPVSSWSRRPTACTAT
jgi:DNA invertase Pin-like site-specific DNA recombinase